MTVHGNRVLIVESRFYEDIAEDMARGAIEALELNGVSYERLAVPGSFEIPAAIAFAIDAENDRNAFDGYIALGCVIRGETDHYDHICRETARALMDLTVEDGIALGFAILTCHTAEQARYRADPKQGNKGGDAAQACIRMMVLRDRFERDNAE